MYSCIQRDIVCPPYLGIFYIAYTVIHHLDNINIFLL
jgi:hypothetical protein